jgi:chaperonin cofactor prefoldin
MPYKSRIKTLEESIRLLDNQIFNLEKNGSADTKKLSELKEVKDKYNRELRLMIRAQWDNDHNSVDLSDDH